METKDVIRSIRLRLGLTEQQLADRIGVSRGSIQQWEKGKTAPKRANRDAVATALGISVAELVTPSNKAATVRVNEDVRGYTVTSRAIEDIDARQAAIALGRALSDQDEVVREQAAVLLKHLALQPERAVEFAEKLGDLLGGGGQELPAASRKKA